LIYHGAQAVPITTAWAFFVPTNRRLLWLAEKHGRNVRNERRNNVSNAARPNTKEVILFAALATVVRAVVTATRWVASVLTIVVCARELQREQKEAAA